MPISPARRPLVLALVAGAVVAGCADTPDAPTAIRSSGAPGVSMAHGAGHHAGAAATVGQLKAAERVKAATARYRDLEVAKAEGYDVQFPAGCAALPGVGAQGYHWINQSLVDGRIELLRPELVMYEPQADGSMALVGVDYIVPFTEWKGKQPPVLLGREFMRLEALGVWALHIWTERANPAGLFAAWNPDVSCAHATP
jgi:hypothetical protein